MLQSCYGAIFCPFSSSWGGGLACLFAYSSGGGGTLAQVGSERWGDGGGGELEGRGVGRLWGSTNNHVEHRACVVGCSSPCCLCPSHMECLVSRTVPTFPVAAEMCPVVIGGRTAAWVVFFCAVSARLCLSACHCNMAIGPALVALGHHALTIEHFTILWLMVVNQPFRNQRVGFFWCSHID